MSALKVLVSPRVLMPIFGVVVVLALIFFAYLTAVASPEENLKDLPMALVNEDRGGEMAGTEVRFGDGVADKVTGPDSPSGDKVAWARPANRQEALEGIGRNEYYGAVVIPKDYSERIAGIVTPPDVPIAVVNEDEGAEMNGEPVELGAEVTRRITAPDSPAPSFVKWSVLEDRDAALRGLEEGRFFAAIVLPKDYSARLAGMSGPPSGAPMGPPIGAPPGAASGAASGAPPSGPASVTPPAPEPAEIRLLTSPAVTPSVTGLVESAFSGIVGGVSKATRERMLEGLGAQGLPVPPGAGAVVSDPVEGKISEAEVSGEVGPLPEVPERAEIEVLANPSAGQGASSMAQAVSTGIVRAVSRATSERMLERAGEQGAQLPTEVAAVVGDPVRADVIEAQPVGPDSGNGQVPFFLAFLATLSGFVGAATIFLGADHRAGTLAAAGSRPTRSGLWSVKLLLGLLYAALVAAAEVWVAFGLLGVEHEAGAAQVYLFLVFANATVLAVTMLLAAVLGVAGIGLSVILAVIVGLVSSGGLLPLEALPSFHRAYAGWLPLRYMTDALRSLLFFDGSLNAVRPEKGTTDALWFLGGRHSSEAAGLESAVWILGAYLGGSVILGYLVCAFRDLFARRTRFSKGAEPRSSEATGAAR